MKDSSRRSFVKTSAATGLTFTFAGLIRAHGQSGGGNTTWNPEGTFFSTNSGETTTYDPNGTYVTTDPGVTTTYDGDVTTTSQITTTEESTIETTEIVGVWMPNSEVHKIVLSINYNLLAQAILLVINPNYPRYLTYPSQQPITAADIQYMLGFTGASQAYALSQTVTWESYHKPETAPPSKYRRLSWIYGGNMSFQATNTTNNGYGTLAAGKKYGFISRIQGSLEGDEWKLGSVVVNNNTVLRSTVGNFPIGAMLPMPVTLPNTWYHPAIPNSDQCTVTFGGTDFAPQTVIASGDWNGTNDVGVSSFKLTHSSAIDCAVTVLLSVFDSLTGVRIDLPVNVRGILGSSAWLTVVPAALPAFNPEIVENRAPSKKAITKSGVVTNASPARWIVNVTP